MVTIGVVLVCFGFASGTIGALILATNQTDDWHEPPPPRGLFRRHPVAAPLLVLGVAAALTGFLLLGNRLSERLGAWMPEGGVVRVSLGQTTQGGTGT